MFKDPLSVGRTSYCPKDEIYTDNVPGPVKLKFILYIKNTDLH